MLFLESNKATRVVEMAKGKGEGRVQYIDHDKVRIAVRAAVIGYHGPGSLISYKNAGQEGCELFSTTKDGRDAVGALMIPQPKFKVEVSTKAWVGFVNCNSGKQPSFLYGGLTHYSGKWSIVLDRYRLCGRRTLVNMQESVDKAIHDWTLDLRQYEARYNELVTGLWSQAKTEYLTITLAREGLMTWKEAGLADEMWEKGREHPINFLARMSVVVGRMPPVSVTPPNNQMNTLYLIYRRLLGV